MQHAIFVRLKLPVNNCSWSETKPVHDALEDSYVSVSQCWKARLLSLLDNFRVFCTSRSQFNTRGSGKMKNTCGSDKMKNTCGSDKMKNTCGSDKMKNTCGSDKMKNTCGSDKMKNTCGSDKMKNTCGSDKMKER